MDEIKEYLENAEPGNVKLYFVERNKNQKTKEISYNSLKTTINVDISKELIEVALQQVKAIIEKKPEYIEYGIMPYSDKKYVETIDKSDVPNLSQLIIQVSTPDLDIFEDSKTNNIFGYIVKIENANETLFLFRKYAAKKLLEADKIAMRFNQGNFQKLNYQIMAIDTVYDAALILKEGDDSLQPQVFIFNRSKFESMFSFIDFYEKEINNNIKEISDMALFDDVNEFIDLCINDGRKIKKFARIIKAGEFSKMSKENAIYVKDKFNISWEFNKDGEIVVNKDNIWSILRFLDDDHLHSEITDANYESHSKLKK
jgi:hypothetical protein